jgi:hypothetical protein
MSIETARIELLRAPSWTKQRSSVSELRPGEHHTIAPARWSTTLVR